MEQCHIHAIESLHLLQDNARVLLIYAALLLYQVGHSFDEAYK